MTSPLEDFRKLPDDYVVLDLETTGLPDREGPPGIVSIGIVTVASRETKKTFEFRVKPYRPVKEEAYRVHGISDSQTKTYPALSEVWEEVRTLLDNNTIVIHNISFDWPILEFHIDKFGLSPVKNFMLFCSQKSAIPFATENGIEMSERGPSLDALTAFLKLRELRKDGIHGAKVDAQQTKAVVEELRQLANQ